MLQCSLALCTTLGTGHDRLEGIRRKNRSTDRTPLESNLLLFFLLFSRFDETKQAENNPASLRNQSRRHAHQRTHKGTRRAEKDQERVKRNNFSRFRDLHLRRGAGERGRGVRTPRCAFLSSSPCSGHSFPPPSFRDSLTESVKVMHALRARKRVLLGAVTWFS